jgi:hypothetical protein
MTMTLCVAWNSSNFNLPIFLNPFLIDRAHEFLSVAEQMQCYRAVLELELRGVGLGPRVAIGSIKHMEKLSFAEYAAKALARLRRTSPELLPAGIAGAGGERAGLSRDYAEELGNWKGFIAFYALRLCLAPLLESAVLT